VLCLASCDHKRRQTSGSAHAQTLPSCNDAMQLYSSTPVGCRRMLRIGLRAAVHCSVKQSRCETTSCHTRRRDVIVTSDRCLLSHVTSLARCQHTLHFSRTTMQAHHEFIFNSAFHPSRYGKSSTSLSAGAKAMWPEKDFFTFTFYYKITWWAT